MGEVISQFENRIHVVALGVIVLLVPLFNAGFDHSIVFWVLIIGGLLSLIGISQESRRWSFDRTTAIASIFVGYGLISIFWSIQPTRTLIEGLQLSLYVLVFLLARGLTYDETYSLGKLVIFTGCAIAIFGILEYVFVQPMRIMGTFTNPNPFGIYLGMLFLVSWGRYSTDGKRSLWIASLILMSALFLTGSRGSLIASSIGLLMLVFNRDSKETFKRLRNTVIIIISALILTQGIMWTGAILQEMGFVRFDITQSLLRTSSFESSSSGRLEFWRVAYDVFKGKLIVGHGLGTYFLTYFTEYGSNEWYSRFAHNQYLQFAAELGLVGLTLAFAFFVSVVKKISNSRVVSDSKHLIAPIIAFLLHIGMDFSFTFPAVTILFFAVLGRLLPIEVSKESSLLKKLGLSFFLMLGISLSAWHLAATHYYQDAMQLTAHEQYGRSIALFDRVNRFYPINGMGYMLNSDNYRALYETDKKPETLSLAIQEMRKAVDIVQLDGRMHQQLGNLYRQQGKLDLAEKHLRLGVEYNTFIFSRYFDLITLYLETNRREEALAFVDQALSLEEPALKRASQTDLETRVFELIVLHDLRMKLSTGFSSDEEISYHKERITYLSQTYMK